mmetsp:Transcript_3908/g.10760  ORF Transcript_3908/g.10760 Transcript_3908/m.10760 type:complete len:359 (+) Transcript_3908:66-1142(+)
MKVPSRKRPGGANFSSHESLPLVLRTRRDDRPRPHLTVVQIAILPDGGAGAEDRVLKHRVVPHPDVVHDDDVVETASIPQLGSSPHRARLDLDLIADLGAGQHSRSDLGLDCGTLGEELGRRGGRPGRDLLLRRGRGRRAAHGGGADGRGDGLSARVQVRRDRARPEGQLRRSPGEDLRRYGEGAPRGGLSGGEIGGVERRHARPPRAPPAFVDEGVVPGAGGAVAEERRSPQNRLEGLGSSRPIQGPRSERRRRSAELPPHEEGDQFGLDRDDSRPRRQERQHPGGQAVDVQVGKVGADGDGRAGGGGAPADGRLGDDQLGRGAGQVLVLLDFGLGRLDDDTAGTGGLVRRDDGEGG